MDLQINLGDRVEVIEKNRDRRNRKE